MPKPNMLDKVKKTVADYSAAAQDLGGFFTGTRQYSEVGKVLDNANAKAASEDDKRKAASRRAKGY